MATETPQAKFFITEVNGNFVTLFNWTSLALLELKPKIRGLAPITIVTMNILVIYLISEHR